MKTYVDKKLKVVFEEAGRQEPTIILGECVREDDTSINVKTESGRTWTINKKLILLIKEVPKKCWRCGFERDPLTGCSCGGQAR
ncbi:hypothetical protein J4219_04840 [Candidatus Woesearchaeota archaeon]|nr:hypothetical protein [Candidatus Woesearchaeota archaeon]